MKTSTCKILLALALFTGLHRAAAQIHPSYYTANPTSGQFPLTVQFNGPALDGNGNPVAAWNWSFGDGPGTISFFPAVTHIFANAGIYQPQLSLYDSNGVFLSLAYGPSITVTSSIPPETYSVDWFKVAGGGGTSTGGGYAVSGTFGQQDAGGSISGGGYTATLGFWSLLGQGAPALTPTGPIVTSQPQSLFVTNGAVAAFSVAVSGTPPFFYQWQKNGVNLYDGGNISGSTTAELTLSNATFSDAGGYSVVIQNAYGNVTNSSVAKLTLILPAYSAAYLGTLGGSGSYALGINNRGQVVGYAGSSSGYDNAFLYSGGAMQDLGTLGGSDSYASYAYAINNSSQVVGYAYTSGNAAYHAFLYGGGTMQDLGTLGGNDSYADGINDSGQVVGSAESLINYAAYDAFLYSGGVMQDLDTLSGFYSYALGINNSGQVVGYAETSSGYVHAFLYGGGTMQDLGTLGGSDSFAYAINNSAHVVGYAYTSGNAAYHAFLYGGGTMQDLGTLGGSDSFAYGINNSAQVVGYAYTSGNVAHHAFLYYGGAMFDLNDLLIARLPGDDYLSLADGINDSGQIIANGINGNAYLLTPNATNVRPKLQSASASGGNIQFSWNAVNTYPAIGYQVQYTTNLPSGPWINTGGVQTATSFTDTGRSDSQRFYRVLLVQ